MLTATAIDLSRYFSEEDLRRGADWSRLSSLTNLAELAIDLAVLVLFSIGKPGKWLWTALASRLTRSTTPIDRILGSEWRTGAVFLGAVTLARNLSTFPVFIYVQFFVSHRIHLSQQSLSSFLGHTAVATMTAIAATALLGGILGTVRARWPRRWWLTIGVSAAVLLTADAAMEPLTLGLYFRVRPLPEGALRTRIEALEHSLHSTLGQIVVLESSERSSEANAYVTGFGPTQEVVLTDTLLALGDEAVMGAVAHEIGHRHDVRIPFRIAIAGFGMIALMWLVEFTLRVASRHGAPHAAQGLPLVMVVIPVVVLAVLPFRAAFGRAEEREADGVELSVRRDYDAYIAEQVQMVKSNAMDPDPPPMLQMLLTHPSTAERIATALEYKARVLDRH